MKSELSLSKLLNVFNLKSKVESLSAQSSDIISLFSRTINELKMVNEDIILEVQINEKEVERLKKENLTYENLNKKNLRIISKMEDIISED